VNGEVVNIPSYQLRAGDKVGVRQRSRSMIAITESLNGRANSYNWLEWDAEKMEGVFNAYPERQDIPENINEQLIVELYSK